MCNPGEREALTEWSSGDEDAEQPDGQQRRKDRQRGRGQERQQTEQQPRHARHALDGHGIAQA